GCQKEHCKIAWHNPSKAHLVSSLAIIDVAEQKVFLVDATPDIRKQIWMIQTDPNLSNRQGVNPIDGIFLTHAHMGHYTGLMHLGFESMATKEVPVYCTQKMANFLKSNAPWSQLVHLKNIRLNPVNYDQKMQITANITITAFPVPHRHEFTDTVGYLIEGQQRKLLYIPDIDHWREWPRSLPELLKQVDFALLDGTFYSPEELPHRDLSKIKHPLITETMQLLKDFVRQNSTKIYFIHLNHTNLIFDADGEKRQEVERRGFYIARENLEFWL
ncbi:MAG: MBL fold metallo-hydrolase, partial [Calditrichaeota bacterium]